MNSEPLDELYFSWLYGEVADPNFHEQALTYWKLLRILFKTEFTHSPEIVNDENRIEDGKALRLVFLDSQGISDVDPEWMELGCSVLELLVGLSRRLEFDADGEPHYWFWIMMENLGLRGYNDKMKRMPRRHIKDVLDRFILRDYEPDGRGGLFPLRNPQHDQRERELWYQMNDYIQELNQSG